jgi:hypothetical protein
MSSVEGHMAPSERVEVEEVGKGGKPDVSQWG